MVLNCFKATESLQGESLFFNNKFSGDPGTPLIDLGRMKGWANFEAPQWFWIWNSYDGNLAP